MGTLEPQGPAHYRGSCRSLGFCWDTISDTPLHPGSGAPAEIQYLTHHFIPRQELLLRYNIWHTTSFHVRSSCWDTISDTLLHSALGTPAEMQYLTHDFIPRQGLQLIYDVWQTTADCAGESEEASNQQHYDLTTALFAVFEVDIFTVVDT